MITVFQVGNKETHRIEVEQPFSGRNMTVKVDDVIVAKHAYAYPPLLQLLRHPSFTIQFSCGVNEPHKVELRINHLAFKYEAYLDDKIIIGCLFPEVVGYNAFGLAVAAFVLAMWSVFGW